MVGKRKNINTLNTVIGKDSAFSGDLKFFGTIQIDGEFEGNISGEGTLIVGRNGKILSDIHVLHLINHGEITGNIAADKKVEILATGKISGQIETPVIFVEKGAVIQGKCRTDHVDKKDEQALAIVQSKKPKKVV
ncbi:MAG: polymer-forming cytoskeletal protein [Desulfobacteraceae bacterium]|nr:polymer-forming cytoskeletal protein [Desulfobacteraceae bacterium]